MIAVEEDGNMESILPRVGGTRTELGCGNLAKS